MMPQQFYIPQQTVTKSTAAAVEQRQRDSFVDVAKGLCMLLIICIHTEVFSVIGMPITFIAVPMFFFMSGFYDRSDKPLAKWGAKALRTILLPAAIWVVAGAAYAELLGFMKSRELNPLHFNLFNPCEGNGPAWFLMALLYAKFFMWLLMKLNISKTLLLLTAVALGFVGGVIEMPLLVDEGLQALPFYCFGKLLYPHLESWLSRKICVFAGLACIVPFLSGTLSFYIVPLSNHNYYPAYVPALAALVCVFFPVLRMSVLLENSRWLAAFGRRSLGVMLLHAPMCHTAAVVLNRVFQKGSLPWIGSFLVAYAAIVFLSYYLAVCIDRRCPILFGKKHSA